MRLRSWFSIPLLPLFTVLCIGGVTPCSSSAEPFIRSAEYLIFPFHSLQSSAENHSVELAHWDGAPSSLHPEQQRSANLGFYDSASVKSDCESLLRERGFGIGEGMHCEPNYVVTVAGVPNDPRFSEQSSLQQIDLPEQWPSINPANRVTVAVLDTGIDYEHPELQGKMWENPEEIPNNGLDDDDNGYIDDFHGIDTYNSDGDPLDDNGHGTHCAGVIGAKTNNSLGVSGIAPNVELMALKFLGAGGSGSVFDSILAFQYAVQHGAQIINASFGSPVPSLALEDAVRDASARGVLVVAAAGNAASDNDSVPVYPASYELPGVISVGAVDSSDSLAPFSNYGRSSVHLTAPGVQVLSTVRGGGYLSLSGTSMAAPHVSGVAALVLGTFPSLSSTQLRARLIDGSRKLQSLGGLTSSAGRLHASNALNGIREEPSFDLSTPPAPSTIGVKVTKIKPSKKRRNSIKRGSRIRFSVIGKPFQRINLSFFLGQDAKLVQCTPWRAVLNKKGVRKFAARIPRNLTAQYLILSPTTGGNSQRREISGGKVLRTDEAQTETVLQQNCMQLVEKVRIR